MMRKNATLRKFWGKSAPVIAKSECKGPGVRVSFVCWKYKDKTDEAGTS